MHRTIFATALAVALVAFPTVAFANHKTGDNPGPTGYGVHSYTYNHTEDTYKDDACPGSYSFMFYKDANQSGPRTRVCHGSTHRYSDGTYGGWGCNVPLSGYAMGWADWIASRAACIATGATGTILANQASSIRMLNGWEAGSCLYLYADKDWSTVHGWAKINPAKRTDVNLSVEGLNDDVESWRADDC